MADNLVSKFEGFLDAFFRHDQFAHAVVFKSDQCIGVFAQILKGYPGLIAAPAAFEGERQSRENYHKGPGLAGHAGDHRSSPRAGASPQTDAEKDHIPTR